jgi:hypothetical protein
MAIVDYRRRIEPIGSSLEGPPSSKILSEMYKLLAAK